MANKEKKIEGRLGYNSENGRYGLLISDLCNIPDSTVENAWKSRLMTNG